MLGKFISDCEDSLTAAIIPHLMHLPAELFWQILRQACCTDTLPPYAGEPRAVEFWPKWNPAGTQNARYVEPDAFIRFDNFDLIIEAKRWDHEMQDPSQWKRELTAYGNAYGDEKVEVRMIALGGIGGQTADDRITSTWSDAEVKGGDCPAIHRIDCPIHKCKWGRLLLECQRLKKDLQGIKLKSSQIHAALRILDDTINLFACHGFSTGRWFLDFGFNKVLLNSSITPHLRLLQSRQLEFRQR